MNDIYYKQKLTKQDKSGRASIFLRFSYATHKFVFATGEMCLPEEWDEEKKSFGDQCLVTNRPMKPCNCSGSVS